MKFKKPILSEGVYLVSTEKGREEKIITQKELDHWANTHKKMRTKGLNIPAPLAHNEKEVPTKIKLGADGTLPRSDLNAGWWETLWVEKGSDGSTLWGEVNIPDAETAKKIQSGTIKETSIYSRPEYKDGDANTWNDALMHVALVTHPIEANQDSFVSSEGLALSMSHRTRTIMADEGLADATEREAGLGDLIKRLKDIAQIALPDGTTLANLVETLNAPLSQTEVPEAEQGSDGTVDKPGEGSVEQPAPIAMSLTTKQIDAISMANLTDPETGVPFTKDALAEAAKVTPDDQTKTLMSQVGVVQQANTALVGYLSSQKNGDLAKRASVLMSQGKIPKDYFDKSLKPQLEGFQMSFNPEGQPVYQAVEQVIEALEAQPAPQGLGTLEGGYNPALPSNVAAALAMSQGGNPTVGNPTVGFVTEPNPLAGDEPLGDEEAQKVADQFLNNTGFGPPLIAESANA